MINNRQSGRRGRGRNPRPQGGAPRPDQGNRIDNRSRGNANQLYEKYKTLARDAQTQGDRVMTEYYLQFADHYFRVLNENRARFEEQRRSREDNRGDFGDDFEDGDSEGFDNEDRTRDRFEDQPRAQSSARGEGDQDNDDRRRDQQPRGEEAREPREPRQRFDRGDRPRRERKEFNGNGNGADAGQPSEQIDVAVLPPAFALDPVPAEAAPESADAEAEAPRRRRTRRPRREEPGNDTAGDVAA